MKIAVGLVATAIFLTPAAAEAQRGCAPGRTRAGPLTIASTQPVPVSCGGWGESCFRVTLRITSESSAPIPVGRVYSQGRYRGRAFSATGVACKEGGSTGLPEARGWSSGSLSWREGGFPVAAGQPASLMMQYECDGKLYFGDQIIVSATLAVESRGPDPEPTPFELRGMCLQDPRRP